MEIENEVEEIEITPEMKKAGARVLYDFLPDVVFSADDDERLASLVFQAMELRRNG